MFRKLAIALIAASVLGAPVMAQTNTLTGGGQPKPTGESPEKAEKTPESKTAEGGETSEKSATKHHRVARHHHHGAKSTRYGRAHSSMAMHGKHHEPASEKYTKYESRHMGHGRTHTYGSSHHMETYGKGTKHKHSKPMSSPGM
jgi:hypothetical protein